jgi:hypothetical protein
MKAPTMAAFQRGSWRSLPRLGMLTSCDFLINCALDLYFLVGISGGWYLQSTLDRTIYMDVAHLYWIMVPTPKHIFVKMCTGIFLFI